MAPMFGFFFYFLAINIHVVCSTTIYSSMFYKNDSFLGVIDYLRKGGNDLKLLRLECGYNVY